MCVWHICTDVKLQGSSSFQQGAAGSLHGCRQRSSMQLTRIWRLINSTYLHPVFVSSWWAVANPRTTTPFPNNLFYMVLHGRRNLNLDDDLFAVFGVWFGSLGYVGYFRKTFIIFTKYNHEIYFRSNCLGWLHVKGLSSWWISSKIQFCLVCVCVWGSSHKIYRPSPGRWVKNDLIHKSNRLEAGM